MTKKIKLGIIGCGNMGTAILAGIFQDYDIYVCEQDNQRAAMLRRKYKVKTVDIKVLASASKIIVLAVKPQDMERTLLELKGVLCSDEIIISIAAGITSSFIEKKLGNKPRVIRCMPNLPAQIGRGIAGLCRGRYAKPYDLKVACKILGSVGETVCVNENQIDSITAVSGSGPAYVFYFVECLIAASRHLGLSDGMSQKLVMQTIRGAVELMDKTREPAAVLRKKVTSKGGTTEAAIFVFEKRQFAGILKEALASAQKRAKELSK